LPAHLQELLNYLEVETIDNYLFVGLSPKQPPRIFGGQVLAQSLNAALRTVPEDRGVHSMHGYFLRPGDPARKIVYEVDPIRDGRSFTTRRVVARQGGRAIFSTAISFQVAEEGLSHQADMPNVPLPEQLESDHKERAEPAEKFPTTEPIERRHQALLAYLSDFGLLGTALHPHPVGLDPKQVQAASLNHALWFHRPFRVDDYLLYTLDSPNGSAGRGFSRGSFYTRDGLLVASSAQEALIRQRDS
jgi:acyl-CoA thioesterase-2